VRMESAAGSGTALIGETAVMGLFAFPGRGAARSDAPQTRDRHAL
jgi:hypothetical protein